MNSENQTNGMSTNPTSMNMVTNTDLKNEQEIKLELNVKPNRYNKDDYAKMSDGMVP